jgi:cyclase
LLAKPRLIFVLLWDRGTFVLSRNFRLQNVGDFDWLEKNYNFNYTAQFIDELVVLNISREDPQRAFFASDLRRLTENIFTPVSAGGWVRSCDDVSLLLSNGADRVVVNSLLFDLSQQILSEISRRFGSQCILASIDVKKAGDDYHVFTGQGQILHSSLNNVLARLSTLSIGEILVNSIDHDGTGMGLDLFLADYLRAHAPAPFILSGGAGNSRHLNEFYGRFPTAAVATAHLFNFIGTGLKLTRQDLLHSGVNLARWEYSSLAP